MLGRPSFKEIEEPEREASSPSMKEDRHSQRQVGLGVSAENHSLLQIVFSSILGDEVSFSNEKLSGLHAIGLTASAVSSAPKAF